MALACAPASTPRAPVMLRDGRYAMGTVLEVTIGAAAQAHARRAADELFRIADRLDALFTLHDAGSPLSRLNARAGGPPAPVDPDLARLLADSVAYARLTRGAFDVTVGPLVALWTEAGRAGRLPTGAVLREARSRVGADGIRIDPHGAVALAREGMAVDLGGVAKGYALDRMREVLEGLEIDRALVSFGQSSILALGRPDDAPGWRLLVQDAREGYAGVATLRDQSISVSGSFGKQTEIEGRRYGHVIDPRSGYPVGRAANAVVLAPSAALAEALSKALLVLDPEEAVSLLETLTRVEGLLIEESGRARATSGFVEATSFEFSARTSAAPFGN